MTLHLEWSPYARCTLVTESTVAETSWMVSLCQVHIGYRVDCCRNRRQISNEVDCHRYSQLCRWYGRLCCRFWRQIGNNLNATACRGRHCHQLGWLCRRHGRLCRKCVRGQSDTVDFVNFEQSQLCWIQLCSQCTGVKNAQIPKLSVQSPQVMTESGSISNKNLALFMFISLPLAASWYTLLSSTKWTTTVNNRIRGHAPWTTVDNMSSEKTVYNSCGLMLSWAGDRINTCTYLVFQTPTSPQESVWGGPECSNRIDNANFPTVFHSNCGFILLSCWDMSMGRTTDEMDWWRRQPLHILSLRWTSNEWMNEHV